jgi:hypothetical protein
LCSRRRRCLAQPGFTSADEAQRRCQRPANVATSAPSSMTRNAAITQPTASADMSNIGSILDQIVCVVNNQHTTPRPPGVGATCPTNQVLTKQQPRVPVSPFYGKSDRSLPWTLCRFFW